jgi:hypothetical protein
MSTLDLPPLPAPSLEFFPRPSVPPSSVPSELWLNELQLAAPARTTWVWQGYLALGSLTLLTSQWSPAKRPWLRPLLSKLKMGGSLAELPVSAGKVLVIRRRRWLVNSARRGASWRRSGGRDDKLKPGVGGGSSQFRS